MTTAIFLRGKGTHAVKFFVRDIRIINACKEKMQVCELHLMELNFRKLLGRKTNLEAFTKSVNYY